MRQKSPPSIPSKCGLSTCAKIWAGGTSAQKDAPTTSISLQKYLPQINVSNSVGFLKGKSSLTIFERQVDCEHKQGNRQFWWRIPCDDTAGKNAKKGSRVFPTSTRGRAGRRTNGGAAPLPAAGERLSAGGRPRQHLETRLGSIVLHPHRQGHLLWRRVPIRENCRPRQRKHTSKKRSLKAPGKTSCRQQEAGQRGHCKRATAPVGGHMAGGAGQKWKCGLKRLPVPGPDGTESIQRLCRGHDRLPYRHGSPANQTGGTNQKAAVSLPLRPTGSSPQKGRPVKPVCDRC